MAKIVVTGSAGFIGSTLTKKLLDLGHTVFEYDTVYSKKEDVITLNLHKDIEYVFHLAAQSRVQPSFDDPYGCFIDNVAGTINICDEVRNIGAKLIYAGSSSKHHNPYDSPYAASKWLGEEVIKTFKNCYNINAEIARFYNVYGPGESLDPKQGNVIGIWRHNTGNNLPLDIVGDGKQRRDFTHVDDIVDGLIKIAFSNETHEDAWELGTGVNYSINELAKMFQKGSGCTLRYIDNQPGNYKETLNTNKDAETILGWKPTDQLQQYIKSVL